MKKILKMWGDSLIIRISPDDAKIYKIKKGDYIDIEIKKIKKEKKK